MTTERDGRDRAALAELAADPSRLEEVPEEELPDLLADLERFRAEVSTRIARPSPQNGVRSRDQAGQGSADQLLDVETVAERLNVASAVETTGLDVSAGWPSSGARRRSGTAATAGRRTSLNVDLTNSRR